MVPKPCPCCGAYLIKRHKVWIHPDVEGGCALLGLGLNNPKQIFMWNKRVNVVSQPDNWPPKYEGGQFLPDWRNHL